MAIRATTRFLVLRGGAIGDFIQTLPALQALKTQWPNAYIELIGYPHIAMLAKEAGLVDCVRSLDRAGMARYFVPGAHFPAEDVKYIRSFDLILHYLHDPNGIVTENLERAGARKVIYGYPLVSDCHAAVHLVRPLEALAIYVESPVPALQLSKDRVASGRAWLEKITAVDNAFAIHPGSGSKKKNWPLDRFLECYSTVKDLGFAPYFIIGEADEDLVGGIQRALPSAPVLAGKTLPEVAFVLANTCMYLGNDSGIAHLAAAVGCKTLVLFGPADAACWAPRGRQVHVLQSSDGAMTSISFTDVFDAIVDMKS